jgi:parvulin-like peptidyl-prolyl isomerase
MKKILKEPLLHFLVVGLGLFVFFEFVAGDDEGFDSKVIEVDRDRLLTFVQFRTRAFEPSVAAQRLDAMSPEELDRLIDDYVREEALHREALALGMDKNDYVIKRRMIQSIEFVTNGFVTAAVEVSDDDVQDYYEANRDDYFVPPYVTFAHVFVSAEDRDRNEVEDAATRLLAELNAAQAPFSHAPRYGDRFPYFVNYVERSPELVASHFGAQMAQAVFSLQPNDTTWQGPFESAYGFHLVMLTRKAEGRYPELDEIADTVRRDTEREAITSLQDEAIQSIVNTYEIRRSL